MKLGHDTILWYENPVSQRPLKEQSPGIVACKSLLKQLSFWKCIHDILTNMMCASSGFCSALHTFPTWIPCLVCNPLHFQELQNSGLQKHQVLMQPKVVWKKSQLMALRFNAKSRSIIPALSALLSSLVSSMSTVEAYHDKSRCGTRWTNCCGWKKMSFPINGPGRQNEIIVNKTVSSRN